MYRKFNAMGFKLNKKNFKKRHKMSVEEYLRVNKADFRFPIKDGSVYISVSEPHNSKTPCTIDGIFVCEEEKGYRAEFVQCGYISVIILTYDDGAVRYLYRDDEPFMDDWKGFTTYNEEEEYYENYLMSRIVDNGFSEEELFNFLIMSMRVHYDMKYQLSRENLTFFTMV